MPPHDPEGATTASKPSKASITCRAIARVLARFKEAGARLVEEIGAARSDAGQLKELAHKLKGASRAAGAVRLGDLAAALEKSGLGEDVGPVEAEWQRVAKALD